MWSGPRNLSTAMMRAFGNRTDTAVIDEPFYAAYLAHTGLEHPMRNEILASQPTDWRCVVATLLGPVPGNRAIFYQKHMTHHMIPTIGRAWMAGCRNAFLIRAPDQVLASYRARRDTASLEDLGYPQQACLFDAECDRLGAAPPVIDAEDIRADPRAALAALCDALEISFSNKMLCWPPGPRSTDGVWAPAWYAQVERSTGFDRAPPPQPTAPGHPLADAARPFYDHLRRYKLVPVK
jgi:hypothetical protein